MRKIISVLLCIMLVLSISACGSSSGSAPAQSGNSGAAATTPAPAAEEKEEAAPAAEAAADYEWPSYKWRIAHACADGSPSDVGCRAFADYIQKTTNGAITVEVFPAGQLGTDIAQVEACQLGDLEFTSGSSFALQQISGIDGCLMWDLPWHFNPWTAEAGMDIKKMKDDPAFKSIFIDGLSAVNIKVLDISNIGSYVMAGNKPFKSTADMAGMKVRAAENSMLVEALTEWGAQPVVINMFELFTALEQGTCDAAYVPDSLIYQFGLQEATPYITYLEGAITPCYVSCALDFFDGLEPEVQQLVQEAAGEYCTASFDAEEKQLKEWMDAFEAAGATIVRLTQEEKDAFREGTSKTHEHWRELTGTDIYDSSVEYNAKTLK